MRCLGSFCGIKRIAQQVDDHLFKPNAVGQDHHGFARNVAVDMHDALFKLRLHHRQSLRHAVAKVHRLKGLAAFAGIGFQLPGNGPHPVNQIIDPLK